MISNFCLSMSIKGTEEMISNLFQQTPGLNFENIMIIGLTDSDVHFDNQILNTRVYNLSTLLPNVEAITALVNNENELFQHLYSSQLRNEINTDTIGLILNISMNLFAKNPNSLIVFQTNEDTFRSNHLEMLFDYIYNVFGINAGEGCNNINIETATNISNLLLQCNFITVEQFLQIVPRNQFGEPYVNQINMGVIQCYLQQQQQYQHQSL